MSYSAVLVACKIRRGAFSGERVIQLRMAGGLGDYIAISPAGYCLDENHQILGKDQPSEKAEIDGFVVAIRINDGNPVSRVEFPDGQVVDIPAEQIRFLVDRKPVWVPV